MSGEAKGVAVRVKKDADSQESKCRIQKNPDAWLQKARKGEKEQKKR